MRVGDVLEHAGLGHLERDRRRVDARRADDLDDLVDEVGLLELARARC